MQLSNYGTFPMHIPIIAEDDLFLYPFMIVPIFINDESNIKAATVAIEKNELVIVATTKQGAEDRRDKDSVYDCGVVGSIMRKVSLPDGRVKILFQGLAKGRILELESESPLIGYVDLIKYGPHNELKVNAILNVLKEKVKQLSSINQQFPPDLLRSLEENHDPSRIADLVSSTMRIKKEVAYKLFVETDIENRILMLIDVIIDEIEALKLQREIKTKVHDKIEKVNKEYFLKEQLKQIQKELGVDNQRDEEIEEYKQKLDAIKDVMPEDGYKEAKKQIDRLARMHPDSADANILQSYIEWVLEIPFGKFSKKKLHISDVQKQLDRDHFSLKKPKDRIVEYFSVRELLTLRGRSDKEIKGTILCFLGPPGVGKTSLANSIAKAMQRSLVRIALGGMEDVNELRGHRRTYIGAMPGRIIQGLIDAKVMNPVVVLDEIDKVGRSFRGDPSAALLEILDPEQNEKFRDYYMNFNIDLSQVIFIATANDASTIPGPLRDRMEFIHVSSYTPQEKIEIAKKYLIPQELKKHGLAPSEINITPAGLKELIDKHTREAGVRNLRRKISQIARKSARKLLEDSTLTKITITPKELKEFLDKQVFDIEEMDKMPQVGVVNGLAWTAVGGDVLKIEAIKIKGKGTLQLTGSLGDVMKESARIAFSVIKVLIDSNKLKIIEPKLKPERDSDGKESHDKEPPSIYNKYDIHLHIPEGATPKDGPSAGITMATAIASILANKKVKSDYAMTGEITLTGKVLPIGGLKEKLIAAHKAKIKTALIPRKNFERDLDDIPDEVKSTLNIIPVDTINDVLSQMLVN